MRRWGARAASLTFLAGCLIVGATTIGQVFGQKKMDAVQSASKSERWKSIPLDVAFPDAKKLLEEAAAAADMASSTGPAAAAVDWSQYVTAETILAELAKVAAQCPDDVKNPGFFKSKGWTAALDHHGQLAMLFQLIAQFKTDVKYKDVAPAMRALASKASLSAATKDDDAYNDSKASTDAVAGLLKNGKSTAPAADASASWSDEVVDFTVIMRRMEAAQRDRLTKWTATGNEFTAKKAELIHEARILAAMAQIILDSSYSLAGEGDYRNWATQLRDDSLVTLKAAESGDFDTATAAVKQINLHCDNCHQAYR